ncbi:MAG TPA: hypothetical protein VGK49_06225 [Ilumatobacteraceae bacterium]
MDPPDGPPDHLELTPAPPEPPRRRGRVLGAVVAATALVAGGAFAVSRFVSSDHGGAASPHALGEQIFEAAESEDVLGLVDLLLPGERDLFRDPLVELVAELERLEVLAPVGDLSGVPGVDFEFDRESVTTDATNVDDIVGLRLRAEMTATATGSELPIGDLVLDEADDLAPEELDETETSDFDVRVAAVEQDGRWYLSIFHSIAEAVRLDADPPPDIPATGLEPAGGESPEQAMEIAIEAVEDFDLEALISVLNPGEAAALQRYAPIFLDDAESAIDDSDFDWELDVETTITGDGGRRSVELGRITADGETGGVPFEMELDDGCFRFESEGESIDSCELAEDQDFDDMVSDPEAIETLQEELRAAFDDLEQTGLILHEHDGAWYVSPIGTFIEQVLAVARALDRGELEGLIDAFPPAIESLSDLAFGTVAVDDPEFVDDEIIVEGDDDPLDDPLEDDPASRCYMLPDATRATECLTTLLDQGEIEEWEIPVELRFPECGVADQYWEGYHVLDDVQFLELVELATPCFLDLVAAGEIEEIDLPPEYTHIECFEGRNWYAVFDDPDYDDRFYDCISA